MFPVNPVGKSGIDTSDERRAFDQDLPEDKPAKGKASVSEDSEVTEEEEPTDSEDPEESPEDEDADADEADEVDQEDLDEEPEEEPEEDDTTADDTLLNNIKAKAPALLKQVPELRGVIFREAEYSQLFPTVEDAKRAAQTVQIYNDMSEELISGNSENFIKALGNTSKEGVKNFAANFIPTLEKVDEGLYLGVVMPELKKFLRWAVSNPDENIKISAKNLHHLLFNHQNFDQEVGIQTKKDPKEEELTRKQQEFEHRQASSFNKDVGEVALKVAKRIISRAFEQSDLSPLLQKNLTDEIFNRVGEEMDNDKRHVGNMRNLFEQARREGFTSAGKDRIVNAYLSRAKLLIPKHRQKVLAEAKLSVKTTEGKKKVVRRVPSSSGVVNRGFNGQKVNPKKVDWSKTDERSMLDGKFATKE